jgi:hypothetical protein
MQYKYANYSSPNYTAQGEGKVQFRLIKQRGDFAFAFFSGDITNVSLLSQAFPLAVKEGYLKRQYYCF